MGLTATSVAAQRCDQDGARGARRDDRRENDEVGGARSSNELLAARRSLAVVVLARGSWRGGVRAAAEKRE